MTIGTGMRSCVRCIYDATVPGIAFDEKGVCNYCRTADSIRSSHFKGESEKNSRKFSRLIERIRAEGRGKKFDCLVPFSGGVDSSYVLYKVKQYGLRPLAYTVDNGWVSNEARRDMKKITGSLGVPLRKIEFESEGLRELYVAALKASIPEVCLPCQVATYSAMYRVSREEKIKYVFFGLSPLTEGIAPLDWGYIEGAYLRDISRKFASKAARKVLKDLNRLDIGVLIRNFLTGGTQIIQLPLYEEWDEDMIEGTLKKQFGWTGGEKHFDCLYSPFKEYFVFKKFGFHVKGIRYAALARSGHISREDAMKASEERTSGMNGSSVKGVLERLKMTENEFTDIFREKGKSFRDYRTHYSLITRFRWLVWLGARFRVLPETTYKKFFA
ncbi:MAG: hypothetical protein PHW14_05585 [Candidatus Omnitrophica bacterium]|nr:hypothetical protein [Candidatus Omnitrophota bacterium]